MRKGDLGHDDGLGGGLLEMGTCEGRVEVWFRMIRWPRLLVRGQVEYCRIITSRVSSRVPIPERGQ